MSQTADRIAAVQLRQGFESIHLTIDATDTGYEVSGCSIYNTRQGGRVGGVATRSFTTETAARDYANGWFSRLRGKGYTRVS